MDKVVFYIGAAACIVIVWVMVSDFITRWKARRVVRQIDAKVRRIARACGMTDDEIDGP